MVVEHSPGPFVDVWQFCARCGSLLVDYRNATWSGDGQPPRGWEEGCRLFNEGPSWWTTPSGVASMCDEFPLVVGPAGLKGELAGRQWDRFVSVVRMVVAQEGGDPATVQIESSGFAVGGVGNGVVASVTFRDGRDKVRAEVELGAKMMGEILGGAP